MTGVLKKRQALHTLKISKIYLKAEDIIDSSFPFMCVCAGGPSARLPWQTDVDSSINKMTYSHWKTEAACSWNMSKRGSMPSKVLDPRGPGATDKFFVTNSNLNTMWWHCGRQCHRFTWCSISFDHWGGFGRIQNDFLNIINKLEDAFFWLLTTSFSLYWVKHYKNADKRIMSTELSAF